MELDPQKIPKREKLILAGLYISKYDAAGLKTLGFESFIEAFNVIGYALAAKPASIKNYRDEFDPFFSNKRKGWHNRPARAYCLNVFEEYKGLDLAEFTGLVQSFLGYDENLLSELRGKDEKEGMESFFAKRLITGLAAENYFESIQPTLPEFKYYKCENTTRLGCGYDFHLLNNSSSNFLAVEVKGLSHRAGSISLTPKEYDMASSLTDRFYLFVVKNFSESPFHEIYQNPLSGNLRFTRKERVLIHVSWAATL